MTGILIVVGFVSCLSVLGAMLGTIIAVELTDDNRLWLVVVAMVPALLMAASGFVTEALGGGDMAQSLTSIIGQPVVAALTVIAVYVNCRRRA